MRQQRTVGILVIAFIFGALVGVGVYEKSKPSALEQQQRLINQTITKDLCERISNDVKQFTEKPQSFRRTALAQLLRESREVVRTAIPSLPAYRGVDFKGQPNTLFSACATEARQWVKIPTIFPESYEQETALVGLEASMPRWNLFADARSKVEPYRSARSGRLALVIGNSGYTSGRLKNPVNDAEDMTAFLRSADFSVTKVTDADLKSLRSAVKAFADALPNYEVGLIYYSGHGIEFRGRNYFLPVDAVITQDEEIPRLTFDATEILGGFRDSKATTLILIIDACRNNPVFTKYRGAQFGLEAMQTPSGSVIAFSAAPGHSAADGNGRNSPYTAALLEQMRVPNKKIEDVLKETRRSVSEQTADRQVPWYNSSLVGDFYFIEK